STRFNSPSIRQQKTDGQTKQVGGQNWTPVTPPEGSIFHAETQHVIALRLAPADKVDLYTEFEPG
ncbi:hypothetical protein ACFFP0_27265, partial [Rhizobium puerariae]